jgi:hypothetical protein
MTDLSFRINAPVSTGQVIEVFRSSGINRPVDDEAALPRCSGTATSPLRPGTGVNWWGFARSLTDYCFCCYLSDLARPR